MRNAGELVHRKRLHSCAGRYCAAIEVIDDQIGLLLAALEKRQMVDNTIIVFTSDHGEMLGDQGLFQKNVPYEAALRASLIFAVSA